MICTVLECEQLEESRGFCQQHLRRFIAGQVYENDDGYLVDHCLKGHEMVGDNVRWESSGKKGKRRRRCRECLRDKARRQSAMALPTVETPKPYRPNDLVLTQAIADFDKAQEELEAKCKNNPGPYMDWGDEPDEPDPPTPAEAARLCDGCLVAKACLNRGIAGNEQHGIWGGRVVHNGVWLGPVRVVGR